MKSAFKYNLVIFLIFAVYSCSEDDDYRVKYPYSLPTITDATVAEAKIMYGDSITLNIGEITDNTTPLSTLEVQVVVGDVIISKESIRTQGNRVSSIQKKYHIPFGPYMPDNAAVEVHLSAINVEGNQKDEIVSTAIVKRPEISEMYLVLAAGGTPVKLTLKDAENYIFAADNLSLDNEIVCYFAQKVSRFGNIDWENGLVFGNVNGELGLVKKGEDGFQLQDLTLIGFKSVQLDLFNFTVNGDGEKLVPITNLNIDEFEEVKMNSTDHLGTSTEETWKKAVLYFGQHTEFTVNGVKSLTNAFSPDFFESAGADKVKFLGETGVYTVYYLPSADYVYIEQPDAVFPDALWFDGVGFGRPVAPYAKTASWNWNTPLEYVFCRKVSPGVFQTTLYIEHQIDSSDDAWRYKFSAKFFGQRGWGEELDAREYTIDTSLLMAPTEEDQGNFVGTDGLASAPGVYRITIDTTTKKVTFEKRN